MHYHTPTHLIRLDTSQTHHALPYTNIPVQAGHVPNTPCTTIHQHTCSGWTRPKHTMPYHTPTYLIRLDTSQTHHALPYTNIPDQAGHVPNTPCMHFHTPTYLIRLDTSQTHHALPYTNIPDQAGHVPNTPCTTIHQHT